jgi:hypothetical protein
MRANGRSTAPRIVLCHELAHVGRADWLRLLAAELLRAAYWFNPLTWMIGKRLRDESERACDDEVMNQGLRARRTRPSFWRLREFSTPNVRAGSPRRRWRGPGASRGE